jgi:hypothetical protein
MIIIAAVMILIGMIFIISSVVSNSHKVNQEDMKNAEGTVVELQLEPDKVSGRYSIDIINDIGLRQTVQTVPYYTVDGEKILKIGDKVDILYTTDKKNKLIVTIKDTQLVPYDHIFKSKTPIGIWIGAFFLLIAVILIGQS